MKRINQSSPLTYFGDRDAVVGPINLIMCKLSDPTNPFPQSLSDVPCLCLLSIYEAKYSLESLAWLKRSINNL